jgi:hypothetical protein
MPANHKEEGLKSLARLKNDIGPVKDAINAAEAAGQGSVQQMGSLEVNTKLMS